MVSLETAQDTDDLVADIVEQMLMLGYTWRINGEDVIPTEEDVRETLDKMKEKLYTEPVPSQMHLGHLIVHHWKQGSFDIYLQMGTYND